MIHLCTCIGSSSSTFSSRKRRGGTTVSCKNCGGRPAIDGKNSSGCLLSTVLELTSLINSDFTWTKISKGSRSSSRRPRKSNLNTITLACGKLLTNDSKDLEMPVSESEKLGVSVLGCRFSEKAEHIPIKKRRFVFKPSSPTHNVANPPLKDAERQETCPKLNSNANSLSATSEAFTETCESSGKDCKLDQNKLVKGDDFHGISILAAAACSNSLGTETDRCEGSSVNHSVPKTVEFNENNVKKEPNSQMSTTVSKVEESTSHAPLELAFGKTNQEPNVQKSPERDVRFSWDLNTVMEEEPFVNEHVISASDAANDIVTSVEDTKNDYTKYTNSGNIPVELKNLPPENMELKAEKCEPLSHDFEIAHKAVVVKTECMHDKHTDSACDDIPVTRTLNLANPTRGTFSKWANLSGQSSSGFDSTQTVDTKLSIDCSVPPGFDHSFKSRVCKVNVGPATKHDLSLNTKTCMENGPCQSGVTFNKLDDEDLTKMELTSNVVAVADRVNKEETEQPAAVSSTHDAPYSDADNAIGYGNSNRAGGAVDKQDESLVGYDSQYEDGELRESAINAWKGYALTEGQSEYDTNKIKAGLDSLVVDASETNSQNVQENSPAVKEFTEHLSGKEADLSHLTPGVVLTEKFHSSDEVLSSSERNEMTSCHEKSERQDFVPQNAASQSDEWKMNVSGWDILPENQRSNLNNFTKTRNFTARKFSYREKQKDRFDTEVSELKVESSRFSRKESITRIGGPSTRDMFLTRSRFQIDRCSSKEGDLTSRSDRELGAGALRSFGRGRYSPQNRPSGQGSALWNRSPGRSRDGGGPSFRRSILEDSGGMDCMMNEGGMDLSDSGRQNTSSYVTRRPFRNRSPNNQDVVRSFGRGRYSPQNRPSGQGSALWNRSPGRSRDGGGPSFRRSLLEDSGSMDSMMNEGGMDLSDTGRHNTSSFVVRKPFRNRSPNNQEVNDFRARLGLRPTGDTDHERFVGLSRGRGRGRSIRCGTRLDGEGSRGRYHGPASDECDEFLTEYSQPFPRSRRSFSPVERRRHNSSNQHHQSDSRSPSRPRTRSPIGNSGFKRRSRSRSPGFRPDGRIRRLRSPVYRDHPIEYNPGSRNNNSSPPSSRWMNYKERPVFNRSPPPGQADGPHGERFGFYDSSRKPKQNEYYRSEHPGRFSNMNEGGRGRPRYVGNDDDRPNNGYRRGGFVKRYNMDGPVKRFQYVEEDVFGRAFDERDRQALELHARSNSNPKPCNDGTDSRFRDFPRRQREDGGDLKRRSRDAKEESDRISNDFEKRSKDVKDQSASTTTNLDSMKPNDVVNEGDN